MTTYTVHFRNYAAWASHDVKAKTPEKALALARKFVDEDSLDLLFEAYDITSDVNEIVVSDDSGNDLAFWYDDDLTLRLAAQDLLDAAELVVARWEQGDLAEAVRELSAAIVKAKGGAA
jgi:hypothetical protein